jgi:hypothetical protein
MKVVHVQLSKEKLLTLHTLESTFFIALGHMLNELNSFTKFLYWSANAPVRNNAEDQGKFATMLILIQILAGKLNASWELFQGSFFGSGLSHDYEPELDVKASEALQSLKRYFGRRNAVNLIRNYFAFHYSPNKVGESLPDVTEPLEMFMERESAPNNLFSFSETVLSHALLKFLEDNGMSMTFDDIVKEFFGASLWFSEVSDGLMDAIIRKGEVEFRSAEPKEVKFRRVKNFHKMSIPWFAETDRRGCLTQLGLITRI